MAQRDFDVAALFDLEAIRALKARYARHVDGKAWASLRQLLTDDCDMEWEDELPGQTVGHRSIGPDAFIAIVKDILPPAARTVHHIHAPEITLHDDAHASGIWAMDDYVDAPGPGGRFHGYGHYIETYRKVDGDWKIASWRLTRIRVDPFGE